MAILTYESFVMLGQRAERLIEPSWELVPPKFPSGALEWNSFIRKAND